MNIPSGGISDVELVELQYPFLYLSRNHNPDSGGFGRWSGGAGSARLLAVQGSADLTADFSPYAGMPHGAFGLFGGYPSGTGGLRAILEPTPERGGAITSGSYPTDAAEAIERGIATMVVPIGGPGRVPVAEGSLLSDFVQGGGGFGDPLDRPAEMVATDVRRRLVSGRTARLIYGVVVDKSGEIDKASTERERASIRTARRAESRPPQTSDTGNAGPEGGGTLEFHASLELVGEPAAGGVIRCSCGHVLCSAGDNYKHFALRRDRQLKDLSDRPMPDGSEYLAVLREYACPGCARLLQVDVWCPTLPGDPDLWDIQLGYDAQTN